MIKAASVLLALVLAGAMSGCKGPCQQLADAICSCKPNQTEQEACIQAVNTASQNNPVTPADEGLCRQAQKTCTCDALADGTVEKCGLAK